MGQFDRAIATAKKLIAKNGQSVKWRVVREGAPVDPSKPWKPSAPISNVEHDVFVCFLPVDKEMREFIRYIRGSEVATGSEMGLMGAVAFEPSQKDVVIRNGIEYRIKSIDRLAPNGDPILYTVEFAK